MPIYEYQCGHCQAQFEYLLRGSEQPVCPDCGSSELDKQFSLPAAHTQAGRELPMAGPNCGRPQCGGGRCAGLE